MNEKEILNLLGTKGLIKRFNFTDEEYRYHSDTISDIFSVCIKNGVSPVDTIIKLEQFVGEAIAWHVEEAFKPEQSTVAPAPQKCKHEIAINGVECRKCRTLVTDWAPKAQADQAAIALNCGPTLSGPTIEVAEDSIIAQLWKLLDDIDTASDMFKPSLLEGILNIDGYVKFYNYAMRKVGERFKKITSDGYKLYQLAPAQPETKAPQKKDMCPIHHLELGALQIINGWMFACGACVEADLLKKINAPAKAPQEREAEIIAIIDKIEADEPLHEWAVEDQAFNSACYKIKEAIRALARKERES